MPTTHRVCPQPCVSTTGAIVSRIVFIVVGSLTIASPVVYLLGAERAKPPSTS